MLALACGNTEFYHIVCTPDGEIDGPLRLTVESGDGTFRQDPNLPLEFDVLADADGGLTKFKVQGDKIVGAGEELLEDFIELTVGVPASTLGMAASGPFPQ